MGEVGTMQRPAASEKAKDLAEAMLAGHLKTPEGRPGLVFMNGIYLVWSGGQWRQVDRGAVEREVLRWAGSAYVSTGPDKMERVNGTRHLAKELVAQLETMCEYRGNRLPAWLGKTPFKGDPNKCIAFRDVIVDVAASAEAGNFVIHKRDERWLDLTVVNCEFDQAATCPLWEKVTLEWGDGNSEWVEVLERELGYSMMAWRELAKWFLHYGRIRGGKSVIEYIMRKLIGEAAYFSADTVTLTERFERGKLATARRTLIAELGYTGKEGNELASIKKRVVGQDPITFHVKGGASFESVSPSVVVAHSNEIPNIPNKGAGLSSKMVLLPFNQSWLGREDPDLSVKLERELPGIALRCVKAAVRLLAEKDPKKKFPALEMAKPALELYEEQNSPADAFLEAEFEKSPGSLSSFRGSLWPRYCEWCREHGHPAVTRGCFKRWLVENTSWPVRLTRRSDGTHLAGLTPKSRLVRSYEASSEDE